MGDDGFLDQALGAVDLVYNIARRLTPAREDAEDLVQETYLRALGAWKQGRRPDKVEPWLATPEQYAERLAALVARLN